VEKKFYQFSSGESVSFAIRSLDVFNNKALVGTMGSELFYFENINSPSNNKKVLNGHFQGELWGLSCFCNKNEFVTVGEDSYLKLWSMEQRV
jgi:hypothetical protein